MFENFTQAEVLKKFKRQVSTNTLEDLVKIVIEQFHENERSVVPFLDVI